MTDASEIRDIRTQEAITFFQVNQAARSAMERVIALIFSVSAIAGSVGTAAGTADVVIPLPALIFLLLSYSFQQYADLTVLGAARRRLEDLVNTGLDAESLIYETAIAEIRQKSPLVLSVRVLQTMLGLLVSATLVVGCVVALQTGRHGSRPPSSAARHCRCSPLHSLTETC